MRDLVIISAVPDACQADSSMSHRSRPPDLLRQVSGFGAGELTRAAEVLATGLTNMRGTTAPQLHLELMSRILLPEPTRMVVESMHVWAVREEDRRLRPR